MDISYILPIKWDGNHALGEITDYLAYLSPHLNLIIVDGSSPTNFERHRQYWSAFGTHLPPHIHYTFLNGKVNGVLTGIAMAKYPHVIIADDDVRYTLEQIAEVANLLSEYQLVSPQNYFEPCPWHAKWDTSRTLLNRAFSHDYPGTLAVQRDFINALGGYDGNVLFENLELMRTIKAGNGTIYYHDALFVRRLPPSDQHFWSQRVRQAYDDYAQPLRLIFFFLLLPLLICAASYSLWTLPLACVLAITIAEIGRRKSGAQRVFPVSSSFFAPIWLLERGICTWLAFFQKLGRGGVVYNRSIIKNAANSIGTLRKKLAKNSPVVG